jgi:hypothetical protein
LVSVVVVLLHALLLGSVFCALLLTGSPGSISESSR